MTAPRALLVACLGLTAAAGLLWAASAATWYHAGPTAVVGGTVHPWLTGVALLALAGVAALVAAAGWARRLLGGVLGLAAVASAAAAAADLARPAGDLRVPGASAAPVVTAAPLLAVAGGVVLLAVGAFVLLREPRLARVRLGGAAREPRREQADPDRAAWAALDDGRDPTVDPPDPDGGRGGGAV